ncbi:MAG: hypothetical protein IJV65_01525 [Kiritimatiellae bacterium]|nr:hypothetical protein [Kiritimatiellia bacterium]
MDISFNPNRTAVADTAAARPSETPAAPRASGKPALVVTDARTDALDAAGEVPESALRRDDALGRLFSAAFALPAPPMPAFTA